MKAIIVFTDASRSVLGRWLRPGFQHCFAVLADDPYWIAVEYQGWQPSAYVLGGTDYDLASAYRALGHQVVEVEVRARRYFGPIGFVTCVGYVKRLCGLRSWAVTPWGLYRDLTKGNAHGRHLRSPEPARGPASAASAADHARGRADRGDGR